ncbi:MAG: PTS sugar transporter subunit IIA [Gemmatimonadota bacterium]
MKLYEYLKPELIILDLEGGSIDDALQHLLKPLLENELVRDEEQLLQALLERERVHSTAIGHGVAIPHAGCQDLDAPVIALALSPDGVDFHSADEQPVHILFLLLSPPDRSGTHIKLLARIARLMRQAAHRDELLAASSSQEVIERIRELDRQHP